MDTVSARERRVDEPEAVVETADVAPEKPRWSRWRVAVLAAAAAVLLLAGLAGVVAHRRSAAPLTADQPYYPSTEALEGRADLIVRASVVGARERTTNDYPETVATIAVTGVAKGDVAAGERLEVSYATPYSGPESPTGLATGNEYVLLLERFEEGRIVLVNTTQGYYRVRAGRAVRGVENAVDLSAATRHALGVG